LAEVLVDSLQNWNISNEKVVAVVNDSAANIKNTVTDIYGCDRQISCLAHTVNLVVEKAIDKTQEMDIVTHIKTGGIPQIISKVREIVKFLKTKTKASDALRNYQKSLGN